MTIEKSLRHAIQEAGPTLSPLPKYRWEAYSQYVTLSGSFSPQRVTTWSASIGGCHLAQESVGHGPIWGEGGDGGVVFTRTTTTQNAQMLSPNGLNPFNVSESFQHAFIVTRMIQSASVGTWSNNCLLGFKTNGNLTYIYGANTTTHYWGSGRSTAVPSDWYWFGRVQQVSSGFPEGWRGVDPSGSSLDTSNLRRNIIHLNFRAAQPTLISYNTSSMKEAITHLGTQDFYYPVATCSVYFGRRELAPNNHWPLTGSIYEVLLYTSSLTDEETGSILDYLKQTWLTDSDTWYL